MKKRLSLDLGIAGVLVLLAGWVPGFGGECSMQRGYQACLQVKPGLTSGLIPTSESRRMPDDSGRGDWPYNSRLIDGCLFAGGTPFHPQAPANSAQQVADTFKRVRAVGITTVIILNVPANDREVRLEEKLAAQVGLKTWRLPMNAEKVPNASETTRLLELIEGKAYVHCQWGADRTGAVVAKYLRTRHGYSGRAAWEAVIKGGSHSGRIGGLKVKPEYASLLLYFWPEVVQEDADVCRKYGLKILK